MGESPLPQIEERDTREVVSPESREEDSRRWLQDTLKRKLADFYFFRAHPLPAPRVSGFIRGRPEDGSKQAPRIKKIGLTETFSRVYPKKASTRRVNKKNRQFHAKSTSFIFTVSCSQLRGDPRMG